MAGCHRESATTRPVYRSPRSVIGSNAKNQAINGRKKPDPWPLEPPVELHLDLGIEESRVGAAAERKDAANAEAGKVVHQGLHANRVVGYVDVAVGIGDRRSRATGGAGDKIRM